MELLSRPPLGQLVAGLSAEEKIVYRDNGNRSAEPSDMLRRVSSVLRTVGISRVADISYLIPFGYPVFQALRPNIFFHSAVGQNTGSQGKGSTAEQARLSAMMEAVEAFCAEPRNPGPLIRGSFEFLRGHHAVANPQLMLGLDVAEPPQVDEPLVWTVALELCTRQRSLIPAESVFYPFLPADYGTRSCFPCGTNGLASGATYLEAVLHGIYEVIERHYIAEFELGRIRIERFHLSSIVDLRDLATRASGYSLRVFALMLSTQSNLPVIMCVIDDLERQRSFSGFGCSGNVETSLGRAISEAWQSVAGISSGAREDIVRSPSEPRSIESEFPPERTLHVDRYRDKVLNRKFRSLDEELVTILEWLNGAGVRCVFVSDLSRRGVDIPVVKIVIPGLNARRHMRRSSALKATYSAVLRRKYS